MGLFGKENPDLSKFADILEKSIKALFVERAEMEFTGAVKKELRKIIDYQGRMRADGMEKFDNEPTYVSAVNFFANEASMGKNMPLGALIVYVEQAYLPDLMKILKYPPIDDESEDAMLDSCGTLCNIVAGRFKSEISQAGYVELEMSPFMNYRNSAFNGVTFCATEFHAYELTCSIGNRKRLILEMTMGAVPKR